jgi:Rha family phage regulatory protein
MNQLITKEITMTSLDVAEVTGKRHADLMKDIRKEIKDIGEEIAQGIFALGSYKDKNNQDRPCYKFGKDGAMQLALKYDAKTRYLVIKKIEELENQGKQQLPGTYKEALIKLVEQVEENEKLQTNNLLLSQQNNELKPKADYYDLFINNKGLVTITSIAKNYGMSATKMNKKLHDLGIQFKQSGAWFLYSKYQSEGYTHTEPHPYVDSEGRDQVRPNTKWTPKGHAFIYYLLKKEGILPLIERKEAI